MVTLYGTSRSQAASAWLSSPRSCHAGFLHPEFTGPGQPSPFCLPCSSSSLDCILFFFLTAGRSKELRPELLQKFTQLALAEGLTEENILILPKTGTREPGVTVVVFTVGGGGKCWVRLVTQGLHFAFQKGAEPH